MVSLSALCGSMADRIIFAIFHPYGVEYCGVFFPIIMSFLQDSPVCLFTLSREQKRHRQKQDSMVS